MTFAEIKDMIMFQTNNDAEDLGDYLPHINAYVNEGYDELIYTFKRIHLDANGEFKPLVANGDEPQLPEWIHRSLADYGTYMIYRNGNAIKQNRGMPFYSAFMSAKNQLEYQRGFVDGKPRQFINIYTD